MDNPRRYLKEDFGPDLLEKYPSNQILKSNSIGIISEEENIFKEFNKENKKENLSLELTYFKKESDIRQYDKYQSIIECIKIKEKIYQFKIKNDYISLSKSISDEESQLIMPYYQYNSYEILDGIAFYIHKFLFNFYNINKKNYTVYSYPMKTNDNRRYFISDFHINTIPIIISIIYGIIFLNFSLRMIDEKEKKLDILLNRYGIKIHQYYISWLLTYIILIIFTTFSIIIFFSYLTFGKIYSYIIIFIISQILFSLGIFSMAFLLNCC